MSEINETNTEIVYPTAFLMMKELDGSWRVTTDFSVPFSVAEQATRQDIRIGCLEIANVISQQDLAATVLHLMDQKSQEDNQRVSASMRDAISRMTSEK